jgi:hypothetical protein
MLLGLLKVCYICLHALRWWQQHVLGIALLQVSIGCGLWLTLLLGQPVLQDVNVTGAVFWAVGWLHIARLTFCSAAVTAVGVLS